MDYKSNTRLDANLPGRVVKKPLSIQRIEHFQHNMLGAIEAPIKNKQKVCNLHATLIAEFIPPKDYMQKLGAKPNVTKIRVIQFGPDAGKVVDVKLCFQCSESVCAANPGCKAKAGARAYLFDIQNLKIGQ